MARVKEKPSNHPRRLVVEGIDDKWSVINLIAQRGHPWEDERLPYVHVAGGKNKLLKGLEREIRLASYERLGVVVDADDEVGDRWKAVCDRAASAGLTLPSEPAPGGTIVAHADRRFGFWLMPDNTAPGTLEDFLDLLLPAAATDLYTFAGECTEQAIEAKSAPCKHPLKGKLHTFLAWQDPAGMPFGTAITMRVLDPSATSANAFVTWFERLFIDPPETAEQP